MRNWLIALAATVGPMVVAGLLLWVFLTVGHARLNP